jgi:hypothetical protein
MKDKIMHIGKQIQNIPKAEAAFLLLFAAEFTYYLLILQTGIVTYHHSRISEVWMVPAGGILGIVLSVFVYEKRRWLLPALLLIQLLLSFDYASANGVELFLLGLISGLTAPMLIYRIDRLLIAVVALGLSYMFGTAVFSVDASHRTGIALMLSLVAFAASLAAQPHKEKPVRRQSVSLYAMGRFFLWLLLDASLFETLSRDPLMHIWGAGAFTPVIIITHLLGLAAAYRWRESRYTDVILLLLFTAAYGSYALGDRLVLSLVYPFVISYYNVQILYRLKSLGYIPVAVVSLSLWGASGLGLMIAINGLFAAAWLLPVLLAVLIFFRSAGILDQYRIDFTSMKGLL